MARFKERKQKQLVEVSEEMPAKGWEENQEQLPSPTPQVREGLTSQPRPLPSRVSPTCREGRPGCTRCDLFLTSPQPALT